MQKGFTPIIILVGVLILVGIAGGAYFFFKVKTPQQKICTLEAKVCPDGSSVGQTGSNCEFATCPGLKPTPANETAKFPDQNQREMVKALDVYKSSQLSSDALRFLPNFYWPKLKPFKSGDKTREVYLVDCQVTNDKFGFKLDGIPAEVPNVPNIAEVTLKKLLENHYGGFPDKEEIARREMRYKNTDTGINGVVLKDGNLIINFYDSVAAYGGGSSRVGCMSLSTELTAKQFSTIKNVTMCIDKYGDKYNCGLDFQP